MSTIRFGSILICMSCVLVVRLSAIPARASGEERAIEASKESLEGARYSFSPDDEKLVEQIERGCFQYFWNEVGNPGLLAKDKTSDTICSTAAVGFQLSSLPIGVERGWITKSDGEQRAITVLRTLLDRTDNKKSGIYLHFID